MFFVGKLTVDAEQPTQRALVRLAMPRLDLICPRVDVTPAIREPSCYKIIGLTSQSNRNLPKREFGMVFDAPENASAMADLDRLNARHRVGRK